MIYNLTQHQPTPDMVAVGVGPTIEGVPALLTVDELPTIEVIEERARAIAASAPEGATVLLGGAPWLMSSLERACLHRNQKTIYAFTRRESVEIRLPYQSAVEKRQIFRFVGFVEVSNEKI